MKKFAVSVLSVVVLFCATIASGRVFADNIDLTTAKQVGSYFLSVMNNTKPASISDVRLVYQVNNEQLGIPAAYIFNIAEQGFVVVSGSECGNAIIGFSDEDTLNVNNMPPAMKWWIDGYAQQIIDAQNAKIEPAPEKLAQWSALYNHELPAVGNGPKATYLLTSKWGQGEINRPTYNLFCPRVGNQYTYAGCVATAMSMIMHYWQYPTHAKGSNTYSENGFNLSVNFLQEGHYDYDLMPDQLFYSSPEAQIEATALLCYHAGVSVNMGYGLDGSGTLSQYVGPAMKTYFKYRTSYQLRRDNYSDQVWIDTCTNEINNRRPMYYSGYNTLGGEGRDAGGHAFVVDGIKTGYPDFFHFNWGWDGSSNSYFNLRTSQMTAGGYCFNSGQAVYVRMDPPVDSNRFAGIQEISASLSDPAFPNPAYYQVTIPYELNGQSSADLQIYSLDGRLVETIKVYPNAYSVDVNVADYAKGVYIYRLNGCANKFVVQ